MVDMENTKKEKAITQALANLQIDRIYVRPDFVTSYRQKHNLPTPTGMKLVFKRGGNNGRKK